MLKIKKVLFLLLLSISLYGQTTVRVMSYNVENYSSPNYPDASVKKITTYINPDALVVVEMMSDAGVNQFLQNCLPSGYASATAASMSTGNGYNGNDCAFYYKTSVFTLLATKAVAARTRILSEFKLVHKVTGDTLIIFGAHLKANDYSSDNVLNQQKRADAAQSLRNESATFSSTVNYLVCGDFNIFASTETAFQNLVGNTSSKGYFVDMMNANGNWTDNSAFNTICTYSTTQLDTRLDMVLVSPAIMSQGGIDYKEFKIFGNDGAHFNSNVNYGTNAWFSSDATLGSAVLNSSDHLPVYVDLYVGVAPNAVTDHSDLPKQYELGQNYPNPFNPTTTIRFTLPTSETRHASSLQQITLKVYDLIGREVATLVNDTRSAGTYSVKFDAANLSSGIYYYQLKAADYIQTKKMVLLK